MTDPVVRWSDDVDDIIAGDLTAALGYSTPAGGVVLTAVAPCGLRDRDAGEVRFTTSIGFGRKLERIALDPRVALAYHARDHGFTNRPGFVLVQGTATADVDGSAQRLVASIPDVERHLGEVRRGPLWDRLLREYYQSRLFVDVRVDRIVRWRDHDGGNAGHDASLVPDVIGAALSDAPAPQRPPRNGTGARIDMDKAAHRVRDLPHRLLGYKGTDGFPVVMPVTVGPHDASGFRIESLAGTFPAGGRRAGLLAHRYRPQLIGLATRTFTGWLDVDDAGDARYSPHTSKGFFAPPWKNVLLVSNGLMAKYGLWHARRTGIDDTLARLSAAREASRAATGA